MIDIHHDPPLVDHVTLLFVPHYVLFLDGLQSIGPVLVSIHLVEKS